jgi:hypothetical protein
MIEWNFNMDEALADDAIKNWGKEVLLWDFEEPRIGVFHNGGWRDLRSIVKCRPTAWARINPPVKP